MDIVFIVCLAEFGSPVLDVVYVLQHYKDMWESNQWVEKFEVQPCHEKHRYRFAWEDVVLLFNRFVRYKNKSQTYIRETPYNSTKLNLKQAFRSIYRHELDTRLSHKPWMQEIAKVTDWPRRRAVAEFRLCVWAWLSGHAPSPHWNPPWPLLHAMQPPRTHGEKPSRTMYRII